MSGAPGLPQLETWDTTNPHPFLLLPFPSNPQPFRAPSMRHAFGRMGGKPRTRVPLDSKSAPREPAGCPRSPAVGDLGYHEPAPVLAFAFPVQPTTALVFPVDPQPFRTPSMRQAFGRMGGENPPPASPPGAPGLLQLETWETTNPHPFLLLPFPSNQQTLRAPSMRQALGRMGGKPQTSVPAPTGFLNPPPASPPGAGCPQISRSWRPGTARTHPTSPDH